MNEKFNKNAKVEKFTTMLGIAVRLIVIDPLMRWFPFQYGVWIGGYQSTVPDCYQAVR